MYYSRLVTVASGAASGKLLQYEVGGPRVSVQTAYGVEVEVGMYDMHANMLLQLQIYYTASIVDCCRFSASVIFALLQHGILLLN